MLYTQRAVRRGVHVNARGVRLRWYFAGPALVGAGEETSRIAGEDAGGAQAQDGGALDRHAKGTNDFWFVFVCFFCCCAVRTQLY